MLLGKIRLFFMEKGGCLPAMLVLRSVDHEVTGASEVGRRLLHSVVNVGTVFFTVSGSAEHHFFRIFYLVTFLKFKDGSVC